MHVQCFRSRGRVPVLLLCCDVSIVRYSFLLDSEKLICLSHVLRLWQSEQFVFQMLEVDFGAYVRLKDSCHMFLVRYDWSPYGLICHVCFRCEVAPTQEPDVLV